MNKFTNNKLTKEVFKTTKFQRIMKEYSGKIAVIIFSIIIGFATVGFFTVAVWLFNKFSG